MYCYTYEIGKVREGQIINCGICKDVMTEERNVVGVRSFAQALGGQNTNFDRFTCPNGDYGWHKQAADLIREADATCSLSIHDMLEKEARLVIKRKEPTLMKYRD